MEKKGKSRPKPTEVWTVNDTLRWFGKHEIKFLNIYWLILSGRHLQEFERYSHLFQNNSITGKALIRLNDDSLRRMGIENDQDRDAIYKEILKQRLKTDIMEIKDLENLNNVYENCLQESK